MRIRIISEPFAVCRIDMKKFEIDFKTTLDLNNSIGENISILKRHARLTDEQIIKYLQYGLDWATIIRFMPSNDREDMEVRFVEIEFEDKVEYVPDSMTTDGSVFDIREERKSGRDILLINSYMPDPNIDLKAYLDFTTFNYGGVKYKPTL